MKTERIKTKVNKLIKLFAILLLWSSCNSLHIAEKIAVIDYEILFCEGFNNDNIDFFIDEESIINIKEVTTDESTGFTSINLKIVKYKNHYYLINKRFGIEEKIHIENKSSIKIGLKINNTIYKYFNITRREGKYILINKNIDDFDIKQSFIPPVFD